MEGLFTKPFMEEVTNQQQKKSFINPLFVHQEIATNHGYWVPLEDYQSQLCNRNKVPSNENPNNRKDKQGPWLSTLNIQQYEFFDVGISISIIHIFKHQCVQSTPSYFANMLR